MEVSFYHLSSSPLEKALAEVLEKVLSVGKRAVVWAENKEVIQALNMALWIYPQSSFLPHGTKDDPYAENQPIYLTTELLNPNQASILVVLEGRKMTSISSIQEEYKFNRCLDFFNGLDDTQVQDAHDRWKHYKNQECALTFWFQNKIGSWEQKQNF